MLNIISIIIIINFYYHILRSHNYIQLSTDCWTKAKSVHSWRRLNVSECSIKKITPITNTSRGAESRWRMGRAKQRTASRHTSPPMPSSRHCSKPTPRRPVWATSTPLASTPVSNTCRIRDAFHFDAVGIACRIFASWSYGIDTIRNTLYRSTLAMVIKRLWKKVSLNKFLKFLKQFRILRL